MNKIKYPLKLRMKGPEVGDLQAALQLLLDRGIVLPNDEGARRELAAEMKRERGDQTHGARDRDPRRLALRRIREGCFRSRASAT